MNLPNDPPVSASPAPAPGLPPAAAELPIPPAAPRPGPDRVLSLVAAALTVLALVAAGLGWSSRQRVQELEAELVRRQQASGEQAAEARLSAKQAQEVAREASAKLALLEARVAESAVQRTQIEDLMQSVARSRDENVLADIEAALRVAMQHSSITGGTEPLLAALEQAADRLARHSQPQLERVRRAIAADIERTRAVGASDIGTLTIRLDEAIRAVDDLPLLSRPDQRRARAVPPVVASAASAASAPAGGTGWRDHWRALGREVWSEVRGLVRVTPVDDPDAMLVAPEQAWFLRENLKLRLLNARLALLSRQFDTAQSDLRDARSALERYFDRNTRSVQSAVATVRQVMTQSRQITVPRPDATLAAIAAASAGR